MQPRRLFPSPLVGEGGAQSAPDEGASPRVRRPRKHPLSRPRCFATPTLSPRRCSDRGHGGQVFGDIVDTFRLAVEGLDVDGCNPLSSENDVEDAILCGWSERHGLSAERLGDLEGAAEEADVTALLDTAYDVARSVFEGSDRLDIVARARLIAAGRDSKLERLVRPLRVVDVAPAVEGAFGGGEIDEGRAGQHLGLEAAVEAFVLAHGLWMIGPRMADLDAMLDQPDPERSERVARSVAPGRTVVGDQPVGQPVAAEGGDELLADRLGLLVGAGRKHHGETRMIVEHGQRMKPANVQGHVALEVHLPQLCLLYTS